MISTAQLLLRPVEPTDLEVLYAWENDLELMRTRDNDHVYSKQQLMQYIQAAGFSLQETGQLRLMICERAGNPIGTLDFYDYHSLHRRAGVGILIGEQALRARGFGKEALLAGMRFAFEQLSVHQLYCEITAGNKESEALFTACGFSLVGVKKDWIWKADRYMDVRLYQCVNRNTASY
jgi:diamine N-acetyltransferase